MEKIIVIGAGPAGMAAALKAKNNHNDVLILESNPNAGKKLLITGAGKCNYLNEDFNIKHYNSNNIEKIEKIINEKNKIKVENFFSSMGIEPKIKNGYYYPNSQTAVSVQNAFLLELKRKKIKIEFNEKVTSIKYNNGFYIETNNKTYKADKVIVACGSKAAPKTGSDGAIFDILEKLNIEIFKPLPALVQLKANGKYLKDWSGIRTDVKIELVENNKVIKQEEGEIQLTDYGVSGICVFQLSGKAIKGLNENKKETLIINFLPNIIDFRTYITDRNKIFKGRNIVELLEGLINYKLLYALLKSVNINPNTNLNENDIEKLEKVLTNFRVDITGYNDFEKAQVCQGGVSLNEVNENFSLNKNESIYIVGETLDVDGDCGGFNIAFAVLSGIIAGEDINDKSKTN